MPPVPFVASSSSPRAAAAAVSSALVALAVLASFTACGSASDPSASAASDGGADSASSVGEGGASPSSVDGGDGADGGGVGSRCKVTATSVSCDHNVTTLVAGTATRDVYWQTPLTPAPPGGYPIVLLYQGSLAGPNVTWAELTPSVPFGGFYQGLLQAMLLDSGFTVIAPAAAAGVAWQTNSGIPYDSSTDKTVIDALLADIKAGHYGPADPARYYATGISSGGYMTSRMAVSYAGTFRALAIQSASYATCLGPVCVVPATLPADHPPTLLLHGEVDTTVPIATAQRYYDALVAGGFDTKMITDPKAAHEWLAQSPVRITEWFTKH